MGSCSFPPSIIFADGSVFCAGGGTGLFSVDVFSSAAFAGGLTAAPDFSAPLTGAVSLPLTLPEISVVASGFLASVAAGGIVAPFFPSGFLWPFSGMTFAAGFSGGLLVISGFSAPITEAVSLLLTLPGIFAGVSGFFASVAAGGMTASVFPSGFLELSSGMTFAAGFSSGLAAAPGFSALLTGAVSLPPILPGVFAGVAGFFASAGAGGDLTDASGFFTSPVRTVSLRLSLPDASVFLTSVGGGVLDLSSGFWGSAAEAGFMPSFLSGGFSVLGGAFGSFAASDFFSGAVWLPSFVFSSGIVFLLYRKMGTKNAPQVGTQNNAQIYRPRSAQTAAR